MAQSRKPSLTSIDHIVLTVTDIVTTLRFYEEVLGMSGRSFEAADGTTRWTLHVGSQKINLHQAAREYEPKAWRPTAGSADLCFLTDTPVDDWQSYLRAHGVAVEEGPVRRSGATGPIHSLYLRDPDGNLIEIGVPEG